MKKTEWISTTLASLALVVSLVNAYLNFFHQPNSMRATVEGITFSDNKIEVPTVFINNGTRHNAITSLAIVLSADPDIGEQWTQLDSSMAGFALKPGEIRQGNVSGNWDASQLRQIATDPKTLEVHVGLRTVTVTDEGIRIHLNLSRGISLPSERWTHQWLFRCSRFRLAQGKQAEGRSVVGGEARRNKWR